MKDKFLIYYSDQTDPYLNLAAEEHLTKSVRKGAPILFLWQNSPTVVIGKNQNSYAECDLERMRKDGVFLARRLSGGGAVYHDEGNLCFSFIAHKDDHNVKADLALICKACAEFGLCAKPTGRNDIEICGKKFSGNAFYTIDENRCHHGTVLISSDMSRLSEYLTVSKTKLEAKGIRSVRSRVVNLSELNADITPARFSAALIQGSQAHPIPDKSLYRERAELFASDEWLFGSNPEFTDEIVFKNSSGEFTLLLNVRHGIITDCRVFSDTLDTSAAEQLRAETVGRAFSDMNIIKE